MIPAGPMLGAVRLIPSAVLLDSSTGLEGVPRVYRQTMKEPETTVTGASVSNSSKPTSVFPRMRSRNFGPRVDVEWLEVV